MIDRWQFRRFIEKNRKTGSTTALVDAVIKTDGILVVHSLDMKKHVLKNFPELKKDSVMTVLQIERYTGQDPRPIFFDAAVLC